MSAFITEKELIDVLDETEWLSAREVWRKLGSWAEVSVANRLNVLAVERRIERRRENTRGDQFKWMYRRRP